MVDEVKTELPDSLRPTEAAQPRTSGLTESEVEERRARSGPNELPEKGGPPLWRRFLAQITDYLVLVLVGAAILSIVVGEVADAMVILAIVLVNAILGVYQENRAEQALAALKQMAAPQAKVRRAGTIRVIPTRDLVPEDMVILETGDRVPADVRLTQAINLKIDESILTGESVPVEKDSGQDVAQDAPLGERVNSAFMGTTVTYGRGEGFVTGVGLSTEIGKIAGALGAAGQEPTHLQKELARLGKLLGTITIAVSLVVFGVGLWRGMNAILIFMTAVSLAVAAIPEGLPAVVTVVLALGMERLAKHRAIMRRLSAVETLGAVTVIASDKTGTLTENAMTVVHIATLDADYMVSGEGYTPDGEITAVGGSLTVGASPRETLSELLRAAGLCSDASVVKVTDSDSDSGERWEPHGDPTEAALATLVIKAGLSTETLDGEYPRLAEIPFDSVRKRMSTFHPHDDGVRAYVKGAPDIVLARCTHVLALNGRQPLDEAGRGRIADKNCSLAAKALRVLAFAYRDFPAVPDNLNADTDETNLTLIGLVGEMDPPRAEVRDAIRVVKQAGIKPLMITGDYKDTAWAISKSLDMSTEDDLALSGNDLDNMSDEQLQAVVEKVRVAARVSPEHKVRLVEALQRRGEIVAMTGDGVNDALALKQADIGVAMGITGTDVAKGAADMVLTDDNYTTIVEAVEQGRTIFSNIRKFVYFLLSANIAEVLAILTSIIFGWPLPLSPVHLLWINVVTDTFPALALGLEPAEPAVMHRPPRDPRRPIVDSSAMVAILRNAALLAVVTLVAFFWGDLRLGPDAGRTMAYLTITLGEVWFAFAARSESPLARVGVFSNRMMLAAVVSAVVLTLLPMFIPWLASVFSLTALPPAGWAVTIGLSFVTAVVLEVLKVGRLVRSENGRE